MANKHGEITESTIARIAGNLLSGERFYTFVDGGESVVVAAVRMARAIAAEVRRTTPKDVQESTGVCSCGIRGCIQGKKVGR